MPGRQNWWQPEYKIREGAEAIAIADVETNECPVSLITPESRAYVEIFERARVMLDRGIPLYGPDLSQWPTWAVDVVSLLTLEQQRTDKRLSGASVIPEDERCQKST